MRILPLLSIALFFPAACDVFVPDKGGLDQPCLEDGSCKGNLVCDPVHSICRFAADGGMDDGGSSDGGEDGGETDGGELDGEEEGETEEYPICGSGIAMGYELCDPPGESADDETPCIDNGFSGGPALCGPSCLNWDTSTCYHQATLANPLDSLSDLSAISHNSKIYLGGGTSTADLEKSPYFLFILDPSEESAIISVLENGTESPKGERGTATFFGSAPPKLTLSVDNSNQLYSRELGSAPNWTPEAETEGEDILIQSLHSLPSSGNLVAVDDTGSQVAIYDGTAWIPVPIGAESMIFDVTECDVNDSQVLFLADVGIAHPTNQYGIKAFDAITGLPMEWEIAEGQKAYHLAASPAGQRLLAATLVHDEVQNHEELTMYGPTTDQWEGSTLDDSLFIQTLLLHPDNNHLFLVDESNNTSVCRYDLQDTERSPVCIDLGVQDRVDLMAVAELSGSTWLAFASTSSNWIRLYQADALFASED